MLLITIILNYALDFLYSYRIVFKTEKLCISFFLINSDFESVVLYSEEITWCKPTKKIKYKSHAWENWEKWVTGFLRHVRRWVVMLVGPLQRKPVDLWCCKGWSNGALLQSHYRSRITAETNGICVGSYDSTTVYECVYEGGERWKNLLPTWQPWLSPPWFTFILQLLSTLPFLFLYKPFLTLSPRWHNSTTVRNKSLLYGWLRNWFDS